MFCLSEANRLHSRLVVLRDIHRSYDRAADEEARRQRPCEIRLKRLKLARLATKEQISALEQRLEAVAARPRMQVPALLGQPA